MTRTSTRIALVGSIVAGTLSLGTAGATAHETADMEYATYHNAKHGFSLTYPADEFRALPMATPDGFQAVSKDGKARLLVGTIANVDGKTLSQYRNHFLSTRYPGARIDYAPVRKTWFVLSGVKSDGVTAFYQRVNFVCGGRSINSWAVFFPYEEEHVYSHIIEQVHRHYRPGDGNCGHVSMMHQR